MVEKSGKLLLIEDDSAVRMSLEPLVSELGFELHAESTGEAGLVAVEHSQFDFVILDVGLPGLNGIEVCRRLRAGDPRLPIMLLSGRADELNKVIGLELGADDYVSKPFSIPEVGARIKAILRRVGAGATAPANVANTKSPTSGLITIGDLAIDSDRRRVTKHGALISLTRLEFDVLLYLASPPGVPKSRLELMEDVWGYQCSDFDNSITTYFSRLRQKIEDEPSKPRYLRTVRGVGYMLAGPDD